MLQDDLTKIDQASESTVLESLEDFLFLFKIQIAYYIADMLSGNSRREASVRGSPTKQHAPDLEQF